MKQILLIIILTCILLCSKAQVKITGLQKFIVTGGSSSGGTINPDLSYENIFSQSITEVNYDLLRPNKLDTIRFNQTFIMNNVPIGASGNVRFVILSGSLQLNGLVNTTPSGTITLLYHNISGILNWN